MKPFFSVIIPVYNVSPYLKVCLDSLLAAAKKVFEREEIFVEFVCINDGSTDGSDKILEEYIPVFENCQNIIYKIISQSNQGIGVVRNKGLENSTGEWILFVDSDDVVVDTYFLTLMENIRKYLPCVLHFGHMRLSSLDSEELLAFMRKNECGGVTYEERDVIIFKILYSSVLWNMCYRRSVVCDVKFEEITHGEDVLFNAAILSRVKNAIVISKPLYGYLQRENSLMHQKDIPYSRFESCKISCLKRIRHAMSWSHYQNIKKELYKLVRTTVIFQYAQLFLSSSNKRMIFWDAYCEMGREIYLPTADYIPCLIRKIGYFTFKHHIYWMWVLCLYAPMKLRVFLLRFSCIQIIKDVVHSIRLATMSKFNNTKYV